MTLQAVLAFFASLPTKTGTTVFWWFLATALVNLVLKDPAEVEGAFERFPAFAHLATLLRKWGVDPVAGWNALASFVAALLAKNAPPGAPPASSTADKKEDSDGEG